MLFSRYVSEHDFSFWMSWLAGLCMGETSKLLWPNTAECDSDSQVLTVDRSATSPGSCTYTQVAMLQNLDLVPSGSSCVVSYD